MANRVNEIVNGVGEIAEQTNLLALNASIEAARQAKTEEGLRWLPMKSEACR
jgi:hypothetical protein